MLGRKGSDLHTYRSKSQVIFGIIGILFFNALIIGMMADYHRTRTFIFGGLFLFANTYINVRAATAAVISSESGVRVRNVFGSFDLKWDEIQRFDIGRWKLLPYVCLIHLRDGGRTHAFGLQESTNFPNESAKRMTDELNEELTSRRPSGSGAEQRAEAGQGPGAAQSELFRPS